MFDGLYMDEGSIDKKYITRKSNIGSQNNSHESKSFHGARVKEISNYCEDVRA